MGFLRLFLALGVVRDHRAFFQEFFLIRGGVAVVFFYIISGFYMSMVIDRTYQPSGKGWELRFLAQRAMRLYPAFWAVLLISVVFNWYVGYPTPFTYDLGLGPLLQGFVIFSDIFLLGLDVQVSTMTSVYAGRQSFAFLWSYYPVFQAWTVAVEITFYIFAAIFALRDRRSALVALGIGVYIRLYFLIANGKMVGLSQTGVGLSNTPWGYHFFGIALVFFMLGWVSYRMYVSLLHWSRISSTNLRLIQAASVALSLLLVSLTWVFDGYQRIEDYNDYRIWVTIPVIVQLIPLLFISTRSSRLDNFVGQFSYPVYLCHIVAPDMATKFLNTPEGPWSTLISVLALAAVLVFTIELPIERARHALGRRIAARRTTRSVEQE